MMWRAITWWLAVASAGAVAVVTARQAAPPAITVTLDGGQAATVRCAGLRLDIIADQTTADLSCVASDQVPIPTGDSADMHYWHEPRGHDGLNVHEHGDAPPDWVIQWSEAHLPTGSRMFGVAPVATPQENHYKHQGYKGARGTVGTYGGADTTVEVYLMLHALTNPLDWAAPRHSLRVWVRDAQGGISMPANGQMWFGWPDVRSHRLTAAEEPPDSRYPGWPGRGPFILRCRGAAEEATSEQWYGMMGPAVHLSYTPAPAAAVCDPDALPPFQQALSMATWLFPSRYVGHGSAYRRYEFSWYGPESQGIEQPWIVGWSCQQVVPHEPAHAHDTRPDWAVSGPVAGPSECPAGTAPQYVAATMPRSGIYYRTGGVFERTASEAGLAQPQ